MSDTAGDKTIYIFHQLRSHENFHLHFIMFDADSGDKKCNAHILRCKCVFYKITFILLLKMVYLMTRDKINRNCVFSLFFLRQPTKNHKVDTHIHAVCQRQVKSSPIYILV